MLLPKTHICGQYFSAQHRPFSNPALVQRSMAFCTPKNKVKSPGGSFILFYGDQGFISPVRALPRFVFKISSPQKIAWMWFLKMYHFQFQSYFSFHAFFCMLQKEKKDRVSLIFLRSAAIAAKWKPQPPSCWQAKLDLNYSHDSTSVLHLLFISCNSRPFVVAGRFSTAPSFSSECWLFIWCLGQTHPVQSAQTLMAEALL